MLASAHSLHLSHQQDKEEHHDFLRLSLQVSGRKDVSKGTLT